MNKVTPFTKSTASPLIQSIMNILIENSDTGEYLTSPGKWSKDPLEGKDFPATIVALRAARLEAVGKFNIVFHIQDTNQFVNLDHGHGTGT